MKLKTLKDLEKEFSNDSSIKLINTMILRQEAIKWVKHHKNLVEHFRIAVEDIERDNALMTIQECHIDWIKHFFNITEKDLK